MNWKILLFFMIAYYIELISSDSLNESSEALTWNKESQPERLYDEEFLKLLNYVSTLCESRIVLDDQDINLLSSECKKNINCSDKEASIKKYHDIMGEVLYVNKDYMRIILKNTIKLIKSGEKSSLEMLVKHYFLFVTRILSFLYAAQWTVPKWQIIFFLFLNDLVSMDHSTLVKD